jgi:hypothetical protein
LNAAIEIGVDGHASRQICGIAFGVEARLEDEQQI